MTPPCARRRGGAAAEKGTRRRSPRRRGRSAGHGSSRSVRCVSSSQAHSRTWDAPVRFRCTRTAGRVGEAADTARTASASWLLLPRPGALSRAARRATQASVATTDQVCGHTTTRGSTHEDSDSRRSETIAAHRQVHVSAREHLARELAVRERWPQLRYRLGVLAASSPALPGRRRHRGAARVSELGSGRRGQKGRELGEAQAGAPPPCARGSPGAAHIDS